MDTYFVYTGEPEKLNDLGKIYFPRLKSSYIILITDKAAEDIESVDGVYCVRRSDILNEI